MFGADKGHVASNDSRMNGKKLKIGVVQARFNADITNALATACKTELIALGVAEKDIDHITVPGALEVAVALQAMAEKGS
jgi:6,7-dimethyl-8-ribityllumazine synthase